MHWYKVSLSVDQIVLGEQFKLQDSFEILFIAASKPESMALFASLSVTDTDYYFSPDSARLAMSLIQSYHGEACEIPNKDSVALLVGHADAFNLFT